MNHSHDISNITKNFWLFFLHSIRMSEKYIIFNNKTISKNSFYRKKGLFKADNTDFDKILVSKKEPYNNKGSYECFSRYNNSGDIRSLSIKWFPQMIGYAKYFEDNKTMSFEVIDNKPLKKYNKILEEISSLMSIEFDSEPVYGHDDGQYIKTKIKAYQDKVNTNFQGKKYQKKMYHTSVCHW